MGIIVERLKVLKSRVNDKKSLDWYDIETLDIACETIKSLYKRNASLEREVYTRRTEEEEGAK